MKFQIFGERCSGTNFLEHLLRTNFGQECITWSYGWKHWYIPCNRHEQLRAAEDVVFLVIVRNFYDWSRSLFSQPHHICPRPKTLWSLLTDPILSKMGDGTMESDTDIFALRRNKILNFLELRPLVRYFHCVQYERLLEDPVEFVQFLSTQYNLPLLHQIVMGVSSYKGQNQNAFVPARYPMFRCKELALISDRLDATAEALVGYAHKSAKTETKAS
jgi:hypothetical protein